MNWLQKLVGLSGTPESSRPVETPEWMKKNFTLPPWATVNGTHSHKVSICIDVNTEAAMRDWLNLLGSPELNQYWIEVAYQCIKMDVQSAITLSQFDPRFAGMPAEFHFSRADEFALAKYAPGPWKTLKVNGVEKKLRGVELATHGREAREHYKRIRGRLPF